MWSEEQIFSFSPEKRQKGKDLSDAREGLVRFKDLKIVIQDQMKKSKMIFPVDV